ncbi:MAG: lipid-binding protein [Prevotella sp.]
MKKYISMFMFAMLACFGFSSCDPETDEEPGGTNVEKMAGMWDVQVHAINDDGSILYEDPYGLGTITINTYNTAANTATEMWLDDSKNFWAVKMKVDVDYANATFSAADGTPYCNTEPDGGKVMGLKGKILYGQGKNIHGMPCDSICIEVAFDDDKYGFTYRYTGVRHSGFYE